MCLRASLRLTDVSWRLRREMGEHTMNVIRLHARLELIEAAYIKALNGRYPEEVMLPSVWRAENLPVILDAVPDCSTEDLISMFNWMRRKFKREADELERRGDELMRELRERKW
jgi:hypothetical protein